MKTSAPDRVRRFRSLAVEIRAAAKGMTDAEAQEALFRMADDYERLAQLLASRFAGAKPQPANDR
ncbi:MAG: hypothetical protein JNL04_09310 [Rhodospirillaceae bacterium]|nr:hypothetical protein [Rhodospirillaceae bacterium]